MLLFADDTVLLGGSEDSLQRLIVALNRVCEKRKLRINGKKSKVMRVGENGLMMDMGIMMEIVEVRQVRNYTYLIVEINADGSITEKIGHRLNEGSSALVGVKEVLKKRGMTMEMQEDYMRVW